MANRTKRGTVTAAARKAHGSSTRSPNKTGSFPVFDVQSGKAALRLRGHARSRTAVINKVAAFASKSGSPTLKTAVKNARKADKKR